MKIIQSNEVKELFRTTHKKTKISLMITKGGTNSIKCSITIDDVPIGKFDIASTVALKKAYTSFEERFPTNKKKFKNQVEFSDFFLRLSQKMLDGDYKREDFKQSLELTADALAFLKSPNLLDRMDEVERNSTEDPLIGAYEDLLTFNLIIVSCKTDKPVTLEHTGPSASGKTYPANHAVLGFPPKMIIDPAGWSGTAPKYDYDFQDPETKEFVNETGNKCIYFREAQDSIEAVKLFKPMMSHDKIDLDFKVTGNNPVTGMREAQVFLMKGIASFILLSVRHMDEEEMSTRTMKSSPKTSKKKTGNIITKTFESDGLVRVWKPHKDLDTMRNAMWNLQRYKTVNIFAFILAKIFPKDAMKRTRDMNRLRGLIRASTVLHQMQRPKLLLEEQKLLFSSVEDNLIALMIMDDMLDSAMLGVPNQTMKIYNVMKQMDNDGLDLTPMNIHEYAEISDIQLTMETLTEQHLKTLSNHGLIKVQKHKTRNRDRLYAINERHEDMVKIPKLTPQFLKHLQIHKDKIIIKYEDVFPDLELPEIDLPKNNPNFDEGPSGTAMNYIFGMNYFSSTVKRSVLRRFVRRGILEEVLFNDVHIMNQDTIDNKELKEIRKKRKKAIKDIKTGQSASEWRDVGDDILDDLYKKHKREEFDQLKQLHDGLTGEHIVQ